MKNLTLTISTCVLFVICSNAQLYTNGFNPIIGDDIGVNTANPSGSFHIKEDFSGGPIIGGGNAPIVYEPMLRLQPKLSPGLGGFVNGQPYWDLFSNGSASLSFKYSDLATTKLSVLKLSKNEIVSHVNFKLSIGSVLTGNSRQTGLTFYDPLAVLSDRVLFKIVTYGAAHSSAANTIEFASQVAGANLYFGNPVRIGGAFDDLHVISNNYMLYVKKGIKSERVQVELYSQWPDYVFEEDYQLMSIAELREFVKKHGHLPGVPNSEDIEKNGINLAQMNEILLEKVEILSLYIIELEKRLTKIESHE